MKKGQKEVEHEMIWAIMQKKHAITTVITPVT
jgi:hypothetical protein